MATTKTLETLSSELKAAKLQAFNSSMWSNIEYDLQNLIAEHGSASVGPWMLVRTAFHGGGRISTHRTATAALKAARRFRGDCTCGCCGVVLAADYDDLPAAVETRSPYATAR